MQLKGFHHVAYRCIDAKQTVEWYVKYLNMDFVLAIAEDEVPSTKEPDPYMHIFLDAGGGNMLAFFELPTKPPMDRDRNTPTWTQHLSMKVDSMDDMMEAKGRLEADGIEVLGPIDHTIFKSIYFFDPNGHRLELVVNTDTPEMMQRSTTSSGTCSTSGPSPKRRRSMRPGCTTAAISRTSSRRRDPAPAFPSTSKRLKP